MNIQKEYERIAAILRAKFSLELTKKDPGVIDVLIILVLSLLMGWDTASEVAERLGVPKTGIYGALKELSLHDWQHLFSGAFEDRAISALKEAQSQSEATWSRRQVVVAVDDTVIRRWGQLLSYLGHWWSGQFHRVLPGQDIVMAVLKVGDQVIPLGFRIMSCLAKSTRHDHVGAMLKEIAATWKKAGIDIGCIPVSMDAGYADSGLIASIRKAGFLKVITGAKGSFLVRPAKSKQPNAALKDLLGGGRMESNPGWGCEEPMGYLGAVSPTFGKLKACSRFMLGKMRWVFAFGVDRGCEILRIWQSHHWVEEFFKRMKHLLAWGSYRLRGTSGAHASCVIPFLAYFALLELEMRTGSTFGRLLRAIDQMAHIALPDILKSWNIEHFELRVTEPDALLH